ncbi:uncharacterized protein LOC125222383 isoform X1 [Salvia hispanica]|uniref:uncharacterized protein LOC125222383 isoform X1 n=1 Tax=Salvia hispanica TaxID=49212 RepID=UPI002009D02E|nr:uncharacterized protein LOC125222383 isoform X1 [Salvia hispanica]
MINRKNKCFKFPKRKRKRKKRERGRERKEVEAMGGGNGQKAKMARERNMEKLKGQKGSQLETNKKALTIPVFFIIIVFLQGLYANFHLHYFGGEMQRTRRGKASEGRCLYLFPPPEEVTRSYR